MAAFYAAASTSVEEYACSLLVVWLVGLVLGWLLPKPKWPKWVNRSLKAKALLLSTPPGLWFRRVAIAAHAAIIVKEVWRNLFVPGTFRGVLKNLWRTMTTGQRFEWPQLVAAATAAPLSGAAVADNDSWYVGEKDLAEFKWIINNNGRPAGASDWELMMHKQWPGCTYTAWRRTLSSGKSEYKSVTISENATAEEFMDFYLDDETRMKWDSMISETQLLESGGEANPRCQVVRWLRTFPFAFISQREYIIARRFFRDEVDGALYAVTRSLVEHPAAPHIPGHVRMEGFHSHWRSRTVPCPQGSGRPAVETTLLHFEDFRINERLARFAVRHGMAGFLKGMIPAVQHFVEERRQRCQPFAEDPASFGRRLLAPRAAVAPLPTPMAAEKKAVGLARCTSELSMASVGSESGCSLEDSASEQSVRLDGSGMPRSSSMRRLGAMMLASGVAIALARTASSPSLVPPASSGGSSRQGHSGKRHSSGTGSQHHGRHHTHRQHHHAGGSSHVRRHEGAARPRRRQQEAAAAGSPEPAMLVAMQS